MKILALLVVMPLMANAQVNRCVGLDGQLTFTEAACPQLDNERPVAPPRLPIARPPSPYMKAMTKVAEQSVEEHLATIQRMLAAGKLSQARQLARTEQERALVREMDRGRAPERKKRPLATRQNGRNA